MAAFSAYLWIIGAKSPAEVEREARGTSQVINSARAPFRVSAEGLQSIQGKVAT